MTRLTSATMIFLFQTFSPPWRFLLGLSPPSCTQCGPGPKALLSHQRHLALRLAILFISPPRHKRPHFSQPQNQSHSVSASASSSPSLQQPSSTITLLRSPTPPPASDQVEHIAHHFSPSLPTVRYKFNSKLADYNNNPESEHPEVLVVGDSIVHSLRLRGAIAYCLSGGKTADFIELIPALHDMHTSVHTVISHSGCNDIMARQSTLLQYELESLVFTVERLGRRCVLSGHTPVITNSSEHFSRLLALHSWIDNITTATGTGFISNFDSFWNRQDLFNYDGLHLNSNGSGKLQHNYITFIAFNHD